MNFNTIKEKIKTLLIWSQKYTKTDMLYLAKGGFWMTTTKIVSSVLGVISSIIFANFLSKETLGVYQYILSFVGIFTIFSLPQMNTALIRTIAKGYEGTLDDVVREKTKWSILGGIAAATTGTYYLWMGNITFALCFYIISVSLPFSESLGAITDYLQGKKLFKESNQAKIIIRIIIVIATILAVIFTRNLIVIITFSILTKPIVNFFLFQYYKKKYPPNTKKNPETISYGRHLTMMSSLSSLIALLDRPLLFQFLGPAKLAIYHFAIAPESYFKNFIMSIDSLAFIKFSQGDINSLKNTLPKKILKMIILLIPLIIIYILICPFFFKFFLPQYIDSIIYSQIYILNTLIVMPKTILSSAIESTANKKILYTLRIINPLIRLTITIPAIILFGLWGMVGAVLLSNFTSLITHFIGFRRC